MEPQKPFACTILDCGMTFTNEDHLHVHTKKHDMVLQLGMEQKAAFAADQTPTPTRFIRNCEEVGLFQDLQNVSVNPFDEGFKRAMETKHGVLSLETSSSEDVLHTPHLVFPLDGDCAMYTANNQRNITISRSSSDESGAVKEYETTTISKLTNEVTTISRVVKPETETKVDKKDVETVSYTNNVIKIHEIRKDGIVNIEKTKEPIDKTNEAKKDNEKVKIPPIMSQQSLDYVVDSLTNDVSEEKRSKIDHKSDKNLDKAETNDDIEVIVKLPNGKRVKMKAVDEKVESFAKQKLRSILKNKPNVLPEPVKDWCIQKPVISCGTLIPVTIRPSILRAVPLVVNSAKVNVKEKSASVCEKVKSRESVSEKVKSSESVTEKVKSSESVTEKVKSSESVSEKVKSSESVSEKVKSQEELLDEKRSYSSASSKRYRERMKEEKHRQNVEIQKLRDANVNLSSQVTLLQQLIARHINKCPIADDLKLAQGEIWKIQRVTKTS